MMETDVFGFRILEIFVQRFTHSYQKKSTFAFVCISFLFLLTHLNLSVLVSYSLLTDNMSLCLFRLSRGFHWIDSLSLQRSIQENKSDSGLELVANFAIPLQTVHQI